MSKDNEISYNSGDRLYRQVKKVVAKLDTSDPVFKGVALSIGAEVDSLEHFRGVLALRKLFTRTVQDLEDSSLNKEQKNRHIGDVKSVQSAFTFSGLAATWAQASKGALSGEKRERLFYAGSSLHGALGPNVIIATEIESLVESLNGVLKELENADIPEFTYNNLKSKLELLIFDLQNSDLFGPDEVREDIVNVVGEVAVGTTKEVLEKNRDFFSTLKQTLGDALSCMNRATATARSVEYAAEKSHQIAGFLESIL